ncbi:phosphatidylinositol-3,5-bisphosphate 3-phosphatase MTMR8 isoform X2 [Lithobates pipiens]
MEHISTPKVENVKLLDRYTNKRPANGTLYLTATHLIYVDATAGVRKETWIAHHHISSVEKQALSTTGCPLIIHCKNFRVVHFVILRERDCHEVYTSLLKLSQPVKYEELYAFSYNPKSDQEERLMDWKLIDLKMEYTRMGIPNDYWVFSDLNEDFKICSTYPTCLVVPKEASEATIIGSSKFRSRERFPVLSYYYKENNAAICRCSQPLSGFSTRCVEDEKMLDIISKANPGSPFMYVVDTRPKLNAMANRAAGKGYENEDNYPNIRFQFIGIENIHVMRGSLQKLLEACEQKNPSMSSFLTILENSGWLRHIKAVMDASVFLAKVLIEKEWISLGHKFSQRCGHLDVEPKEVSPIFTQFVECVWHLMEQFPCAFEFSEKYLLEIHDHVYSCQFGNLLGNSQKERMELKIYENTHSLWPFLLERKQEFVNPLYIPNAYKTLQPNTLPFFFKFWCGMYNRFDSGMHPRQSVLDYLLESLNQKATLETSKSAMENKLLKQNSPLQDPSSTPKYFEPASGIEDLADDLLDAGEGYPDAHLSNGSVENFDSVVCKKNEMTEEQHGNNIYSLAGSQERSLSENHALSSNETSGTASDAASQHLSKGM